MFVLRRFGLVSTWVLCLAAAPVLAQSSPDPSTEPGPDAAVPEEPATPDGGSAAPATEGPDAGLPETPPEEVAAPEPTQVAEPVEEEVKGAENVEQILQPKLGPCGDKPCPPTHAGPAPAQPPPPMFLWTTASWSDTLGSAHCSEGRLPGTDLATRIASTLKQAVGRGGVGIAAAGAFGDHPLIEFAARQMPDQLAQLFVDAKYSAIALGISDLSGALVREPGLSNALASHGLPVIASNLVCGGQTWCASWITAEDPLFIVERDGHRFAFISVLPDDTLARVEPAGSRNIELRAAADTLTERMHQARAAGVELVIASIDHGPDATAAVNLASFVSQLPSDGKPDLVFSPSAADSLLFLRPLEVRPAVVGTRAGALTSVRVTRIPNSDDSDVLARAVRLSDPDPDFAQLIDAIGVGYCRARGNDLPGGQLDAPMSNTELVELTGNAMRQLTEADLAIVDPLVFDDTFAQPRESHLQVGQAERAIELDSPLVTANVTLDWIGAASKALEGLRPLVLIGTAIDDGDQLIAGRYPVIGSTYSVVTSAVLARSGRLPGGPEWSRVDGPGATLRGALLKHLSTAAPTDPRERLIDPRDRTQWVLRADGQVQGNITAVDSPYPYPEPALQVNNSRQLGVRLVLNMDADAPKFLFENTLQVGFDRNFTTKTTATDLIFLRSTYTYRGLWPKPLLYPHPFAEAYVETEFDKGTEPGAYHHLLLRPEVGIRSIFSRVFSLKLLAGMEYEAFAPNTRWYPGLGAELVLKPWVVVLSNGTLNLEGNIIYFLSGPGTRDQHTLRGNLIAALQLIGPLQFTLTALGTVRKDNDEKLGKGFGIQAGVRLRFVDRMMD